MDRIFNELSIQLANNSTIKKDDINICSYGLKMFFLSVIETLSILLLSILIGNLSKTVIFLIAMLPLRIFAGGYHADTKLRCYFIFIFVYSIFSVLIKYLNINHYMHITIFSSLFTLIVTLLFSPVFSDKKDLSDKEIFNYRKISIVINTILLLVTLLSIMFLGYNIYILSFALGQLAVSLSIIAAMIKKYLKIRKEVVINEKKSC